MRFVLGFGLESSVRCPHIPSDRMSIHLFSKRVRVRVRVRVRTPSDRMSIHLFSKR